MPLTRQARWVSSSHVGKVGGFGGGAFNHKEGTMLLSKSLSPQMPQRRVSARSFLFPWHSQTQHLSQEAEFNKHLISNIEESKANTCPSSMGEIP